MQMVHFDTKIIISVSRNQNLIIQVSGFQTICLYDRLHAKNTLTKLTQNDIIKASRLSTLIRISDNYFMDKFCFEYWVSIEKFF